MQLRIGLVDDLGSLWGAVGELITCNADHGPVLLMQLMKVVDDRALDSASNIRNS